jgi:AcrR family transcriptional regulator
MTIHTKDEILQQTTKLLAREGSAGTSMRKVASAVGIEPSVIYNHFADKESLLRSTRMFITSRLDVAMRETLANVATKDMLRASLRFQIEQRELIVALLQYFMATRDDFPETEYGYVPARAYQHMTNLLQAGIDEGIYQSANVMLDAKLITHMVNGFLMEYFDRRLTSEQINSLADHLAEFIERSIVVPRK